MFFNKKKDETTDIDLIQDTLKDEISLKDKLSVSRDELEAVFDTNNTEYSQYQEENEEQCQNQEEEQYKDHSIDIAFVTEVIDQICEMLYKNEYNVAPIRLSRNEYFYDKYLEKEEEIREQWKREIESFNIAELLTVIRSRYAGRVPNELSGYGEIIKDEMCSYAEHELRKRARINQNRKSLYHVFGELICKSFDHNNMFPQKNSYQLDNATLVSWIRERYAYLYANLEQEDFKTECQSGLDMIDLDEKLEKKLKANYTSLEKRSKNHIPRKSKELEEQMFRYLDEILNIRPEWPDVRSSEEKEKDINKKYKENYKPQESVW